MLGLAFWSSERQLSGPTQAQPLKWEEVSVEVSKTHSWRLLFPRASVASCQKGHVLRRTSVLQGCANRQGSPKQLIPVGGPSVTLAGCPLDGWSATAAV